MKWRPFLMTFLSLSILSACSNANGNAKSESSPQNTQTTQQASTATSDSAYAGEHKDIADKLSANLAKSGIQARVENILPTAMPDMYMVNLTDMAPIFTDKTGTYLIQGEIIQVGGERPVNISEQLQAQIAKTELSKVDKSEMIIFPAQGTPKAAVYVFSDPTCHYCQLLHKEIKDINAQGIEVRYLAWSRSEQVIPLAQAIWCSSDRKQALTDAKQGKPPTGVAACQDPVTKHMALGFKLGVSGTPAIFTENGQQIGGYLPAKELARAAIEHKNAP